MSPYPMTGPQPGQALRTVLPLLEQLSRQAQAGVPLGAMLEDALLVAFLMGSGLEPGAAAARVRQWRGVESAAAWPPAPAPLQQGQGSPPGSPHPGPAAGPVPSQAAQAARAQLLQAVAENIRDEISSAVFYADLAERARREGKSEALVAYIRHALEDEIKHFRALQEVHIELAGQKLEAEPVPVNYDSLAEGLQRAIDDEYEAFETYRDLYLRVTDPELRDLLFEVLTDELEHATRFQLLLGQV